MKYLVVIDSKTANELDLGPRPRRGVLSVNTSLLLKTFDDESQKDYLLSIISDEETPTPSYLDVVVDPEAPYGMFCVLDSDSLVVH